MATIEHIYANDWIELSSIIDDFFKHYNTYIFRGQADTEWLLTSTLQRSLDNIFETSAEKNSAITQHLIKFKENLRGRSDIDLNNASEEEIWAMGQHFGLNTPLLDWTKSPYVGLFFSLFGECKSGKRVLWALHESDISEINKKKKKNFINIVNPLTHYNNRLVNQRGLFLNIPINIDLIKWVESASNLGWVTMYKIEFPDEIRKEILTILDIKNINALSLFPDIYGSSQYANYQLEIEPYLKNERIKVWDNI